MARRKKEHDGLSQSSTDSGQRLAASERSKADELEYWGFIARAKREVSQRLNDVDTDPSHLALFLNRASGIVTHVTEAAVHRPLNLTWSGFRMLFVLWIVGETEQSKLTLLTNSSKATVSNLINGLVKNGFIDRKPSASDRRTFLVSLTELGRQTVTRAYIDQNELLIQWSSVLNEEERDTLIGLLEKLMRRRDVFGYRSTN